MDEASEFVSWWDRRRPQGSSSDAAIALLKVFDEHLWINPRRYDDADLALFMVAVGERLSRAGKFDEAFLVLVSIGARFKKQKKSDVRECVVRAAVMLASQAWRRGKAQECLEGISTSLREFCWRRGDPYVSIQLARLYYLKAVVLSALASTGDAQSARRGLTAYRRCLSMLSRARFVEGEPELRARILRDKAALLAAMGQVNSAREYLQVVLDTLGHEDIQSMEEIVLDVRRMLTSRDYSRSFNPEDV